MWQTGPFCTENKEKILFSHLDVLFVMILNEDFLHYPAVATGCQYVAMDVLKYKQPPTSYLSTETSCVF